MHVLVGRVRAQRPRGVRRGEGGEAAEQRAVVVVGEQPGARAGRWRGRASRPGRRARAASRSGSTATAPRARATGRPRTGRPRALPSLVPHRSCPAPRLDGRRGHDVGQVGFDERSRPTPASPAPTSGPSTTLPTSAASRCSKRDPWSRRRSGIAKNVESLTKLARRPRRTGSSPRWTGSVRLGRSTAMPGLLAQLAQPRPRPATRPGRPRRRSCPSTGTLGPGGVAA